MPREFSREQLIKELEDADIANEKRQFNFFVHGKRLEVWLPVKPGRGWHVGLESFLCCSSCLPVGVGLTARLTAFRSEVSR
jgi:hypothetical protein